MGSNHRREFLKKSTAGICGAMLAPGMWKTSFGQAGQTSPAPSLPSRPLGKTGLQIPLLSMGTGETTSAGFIRRAYDAGIRLFFSATYYGMGNNEKLVGEALRGLPRDSFIVGTAATPEGFNPRGGGGFPKDLTAQSYMKTAEESLKRFGLDHVDILLLPFAGKRETVLFEPVLEAMASLKQQGKIRFAGIASHHLCAEALKAAVDTKVYDVAMPAYNYKIQDKAAMDEALAGAAKAGIGVVAMKTTAGVVRDKDRAQPLNTTAALKWVLQNPHISSIVSGMSAAEELQKNLEMLKDLKLSEQELKDLDLANLKTDSGLYCQQCQKCLSQCPNHLEIPTLMRGYMYAYGYRHLELARATIDAADVPGHPCAGCDDCHIICTAGFDVRERVRDIARLRDVPLDFIRA